LCTTVSTPLCLLLLLLLLLPPLLLLLLLLPFPPARLAPASQ
jgi:hypothetical protein